MVVEPSTSSVGTGAEKNTLQTRVYSRVGEDNSLRYQHVAKRVGELLQQRLSGVEEFRSCILDGEMVAINRTSGRLLPFQSLARRMRDGSDNKSNTTTTQETTPPDALQSTPLIHLETPFSHALAPSAACLLDPMQAPDSCFAHSDGVQGALQARLSHICRRQRQREMEHTDYASPLNRAGGVQRWSRISASSQLSSDAGPLPGTVNVMMVSNVMCW